MRDSKGRFIKGYKPTWSEESRKKVSDSTKGLNTWSKGRKITDEHKEKCRQNSAKYWLGKKRPELTGNLHPNWKENKVSPLRCAIRESFRYKTWRMDILKRDLFRCQICGKTNKLEVDHYPKRFVDLLDEYVIDSFDKAIDCENLWKLEHGRTLCKHCHRLTPTFGKKGQCTNKDIV